MDKSKGWLFGAILLIFCFIFQLIGAIRYSIRMPDDLIGIVLYFSALVFFAIAAFGFYINWKK